MTYDGGVIRPLRNGNSESIDMISERHARGASVSRPRS